MSSKIFLSVVIPAYNEEKRISTTLLDVDHYFNSSRFADLLSKHGEGKFNAADYEIIVAEDGSTDKTAEIVAGLSKLVKNLRLDRSDKRGGKGAGVKRGILGAKGRYRLFMDADNSTTIEQIEKFFPYFKDGYDVLIGSRAVKGAEIPVHQPFLKELAGKLGNIFIQVVAVSGIWDTQAGFKIFTEKATEAIFPKLTIFGWGFDVEILAIADHLDFKIKEIPIRWENNAESRVRLSSYFKVLAETVKVRWNLWRNKYEK